MPRNILLITTDQQRYDSLGVHGRYGCLNTEYRCLGAQGDHLSTGEKSMSCLHAGALDHPDRPACADARRDIKRHPIAGGSSECRARIEGRRLQHGVDRESAF